MGVTSAFTSKGHMNIMKCIDELFLTCTTTSQTILEIKSLEFRGDVELFANGCNCFETVTGRIMTNSDHPHNWKI